MASRPQAVNGMMDTIVHEMRDTLPRDADGNVIAPMDAEEGMSRHHFVQGKENQDDESDSDTEYTPTLPDAAAAKKPGHKDDASSVKLTDVLEKFHAKLRTCPGDYSDAEGKKIMADVDAKSVYERYEYVFEVAIRHAVYGPMYYSVATAQAIEDLKQGRNTTPRVLIYAMHRYLLDVYERVIVVLARHCDAKNPVTKKPILSSPKRATLKSLLKNVLTLKDDNPENKSRLKIRVPSNVTFDYEILPVTDGNTYTCEVTNKPCGSSKRRAVNVISSTYNHPLRNLAWWTTTVAEDILPSFLAITYIFAMPFLLQCEVLRWLEAHKNELPADKEEQVTMVQSDRTFVHAYFALAYRYVDHLRKEFSLPNNEILSVFELDEFEKDLLLRS